MNIGDVVSRSAQKYGRRVALISDNKSCTFKEVNDRVNRLANSLLGLSLKKGDRVALLLPNCIEFVECDFALAKAGLVRVSLNVRLALDDHQYFLTNSGASALIFDSSFLGMATELAQTASSVKYFICVRGSDSPFIAYEELVRKGSAAEPQAIVLEDDTYGFFYSSGTTGNPKAAMITHKNYLSLTYNLLMERDVWRTGRMLHVGPMTHASGIWLLPHFSIGAVNVILPKFDIEMVLKTVQEQQITTTMMVPTMILRLLSYPHVDNYDISSLQCIIYGGSPMPLERLKEAIARFGGIFSQNYGQTEAPTTITHLPREYYRLDGAPEDLKKLSSAGFPYIRVQVRVVDESGMEVKPGERGEITVKSEHVMKGYWGMEEATKQKIVDGWLHTGDVATVDEEGFIYIVDRKSDMIISGGFNIYPKEIEELLYSHPAVERAAVIGVPDPYWVEAVKAFVVVKDGHVVSEKELITFCKERLAGIKVPKAVEFIDQMPSNVLGKIQKNELRARSSRK